MDATVPAEHNVGRSSCEPMTVSSKWPNLALKPTDRYAVSRLRASVAAGRLA